MAVSRVQFNHAESAGSGGTIACTLNGVAAASLVVVNSTCGDSQTISNVKDDLLVTASVATGAAVDWTSGTQRAGQHYFENYGGGNRTFTTTFSAPVSFRGVVAVEYNGAVTSGAFDQGTSATAGSGSVSSGAVTPAQSNSLFVGYAVAATQPTSAAPFSDVFSDTTNTADAQDYIQGTAASQAATWGAGSGGFGALVGVYKSAGGAAAGPFYSPQKYTLPLDRFLFKNRPPFPQVNRFIVPSYVSPPVTNQTFQQALDGGITPGGDVIDLVGKVFDGAVVPTGDLVRQTNKMLAGSTTTSGLLSRLTSKFFGGGISPSGSLVRQINKAFAGGITPAGALAAIKIVLKSLAGGTTPSGALTRRTNKPLAGGVTPTGSLTRFFQRVFAGSVTPAGALTKRTNKTFAGSTTPGGALTPRANKVLTGALSPSGALIRQTNKNLAGGITPAGSLGQVKVFLKSLTGATTPAGSLTSRVGKALAGSVGPSGTLTRLVQHVLSLAGSILPTGALAKRSGKTVSGATTPTGALTAVKVFLRSLAGAVTPSGTLVRQTNKVLTGSTTPTGTLTKRTSKTFAGSITPTGALATAKQVLKALAGGITPTGAVIRRAGKTLQGFIMPGVLNLVLWSEDLSNSAWFKADVTATPNAGPSPDGLSNATRISTKGTPGAPYFNQLISMQVGQWLYRSIFAQAETTPNVIFEWLGASWKGGTNAVFDLTAGTLVSGKPTDGITPVPGFPGWYRLWSSREALVTNPGMATFTGGYTASYPTAGSSVLYWGAMWQRSGTLGPYIKTTSAPARLSPLGRKVFKALGGQISPTGQLVISKFIQVFLTGVIHPIGDLLTHFLSAFSFVWKLVYAGPKQLISRLYSGPKHQVKRQDQGPKHNFDKEP